MNNTQGTETGPWPRLRYLGSRSIRQQQADLGTVPHESLVSSCPERYLGAAQRRGLAYHEYFDEAMRMSVCPCLTPEIALGTFSDRGTRRYADRAVNRKTRKHNLRSCGLGIEWGDGNSYRL